MAGRRYRVSMALASALSMAVVVLAPSAPADAANSFCGKTSFSVLHDGYWDTWVYERHYWDDNTHHHIWHLSSSGRVHDEWPCPSD